VAPFSNFLKGLGEVKAQAKREQIRLRKQHIFFERVIYLPFIYLITR
jgi:hypothetical protein